MSQGSILTDMFANSSASINALLAQMQNALGNGSSTDSDFSSLLSDSTTTANISASIGSSAQTDAVTAAPATSDASATLSTTTSSNASELKNMQDLSAILHKAMNILRQQEHKNPTNKTQTSATTSFGTHKSAMHHATPSVAANQSQTADTQDTNNPSDDTVSTNSTQTSNLQSSAADKSTDAGTNDGADKTDAQTVEKLVAELLLLTQTVIKNLQQAQSAIGTAQNTASPSPDTKIVNDLQDLLASLTGGLTADNKMASSGDVSSPDLAAQISSSPDVFQKLMAVLQKAAKQVTSDDTQTAQDDTAAPAVAASIDSSDLTVIDKSTLPAITDSGDLMAQLTNINARIKDAVSVQTQGTEGVSAQTSSTIPAASTGSAATTVAARTVTATTSTAAIQNASLNGNVSQSQNASSDSTAAQPLTTLLASKTFENAGAGTENDPSMHNGNGTGVSSFDAAMMLSNETGSATGASNFADHLASMRMTATAVLQQPSAVDQAIFQISRGLKNGNDQMSLQLHPADLGKITVKLDFTNDGKVQGTVTADNPKTLELLQKDSRSLERALQDAGLRADPGSLSFNLGNPSGQNSGQTAAGKNNTSDTTNPDGTISANEDTGLADGIAGTETYYITPTGVNIRV